MLVEINGVSKTYQSPDSEIHALRDIAFGVAEGEFVSIVGPSGCGKSTLLSIIAGLDAPSGGEIRVDGETLRGVSRKIGYMPQKDQLFPWRSIWDNVTLGLELQRQRDGAHLQRVKELLERYGLGQFAQRAPGQLSGGMRQRCALIRTLATDPRILLLDEPFSALDYQTRLSVSDDIHNIIRREGKTALLVTHDISESVSMSDRVVVMQGGNILQIGTPQDIYNEPINAFVADFIGESNIVEGVMRRDYYVEFAGRGFDCVDFGFDPDQRVDVVIRPEDIDIVPAEEGMWTGVVESVVFKGVHYEIAVEGCGHHWIIHSTDYCEPGTFVGMKLTPDDIHIMDRELAEEQEAEGADEA